MKAKQIFEMDLKTNEKLFLLYLVNKGCHLKPKKIDTEELERSLDMKSPTLWRTKTTLKERGLIKVTRASANAIQEYEVLTPSDAK